LNEIAPPRQINRSADHAKTFPLSIFACDGCDVERQSKKEVVMKRYALSLAFCLLFASGGFAQTKSSIEGVWKITEWIESGKTNTNPQPGLIICSGETALVVDETGTHSIRAGVRTPEVQWQRERGSIKRMRSCLTAQRPRVSGAIKEVATVGQKVGNSRPQIATSGPTSWSADGRFLAYMSSDGPNGKGDIWVLPLAGERKPFPFLQTPQFDEQRARFSPDGRFVAYDSDESGKRQVYVTAFPGPGGKQQVSTDGGEDAVWRGDGRELFFLSEGKLMAAEVKTNGSGLEIGNVQLLFDAHSGYGRFPHYDVTRDGKRFIVATVGEGGTAPMNLVVNWTADLKK
jgi:WD40-like Beta Propeller Repeat